jgi:transposase InsO family protein
MDQKRLFITDYRHSVFPFAELCARYGISRKTGYKWVGRFLQGGYSALGDKSRRPQTCAHRTAAAKEDVILDIRRHHPFWGAKKLLKLCRRRQPKWTWPARSTTCSILKRNGLIPEKRRRRPLGHPGRPMLKMNAPNDIWTTDYKGEFKTLDGRYCYPLTVADGFSRFLLGIQSLLSPCYEATKYHFTRLFQEYGLPQVIRSDNGAPFASTAIGRLSRLSVWWIKLGIFPELTEPASPQQNGRHERMHKTLKQATTHPPAANFLAQQDRFDSFREEFNNVRPHEALDQETPASQYTSSSRPFPKRLPKMEYPAHYERRLVSHNGGIRWHHRWVNVSKVLMEEHLGLEEVDDGIWNVYFGPMQLGQFDERTNVIEDALGHKDRHRRV